MTNTNQPLYKQLNEQRTQGEWQVKENLNGRIEIETKGFNYSGRTIFETNKDNDQYEANTKYAALAINNLHILAEALEKMCGNYHTIINVLENWNESRIDKPYTNILESMKLKLKNGEEALNRIS